MRLNDRLAADVDSAFEAFVVAHQDAVFSAARRLSACRSDAEDAAQEVFVRAYQSLTRWEADRIRELTPKPWLAQITLNVCRNRARSSGRRPQTSPLDGVAEPASPSLGPDALAERDDVLGHLAALPDRYRVPLVLRHAYGLSYDELADALGRPVGTVKAQVSRALQLVKEQQ